MKRDNLVVMIIDNNSELSIEDGLQQCGYNIITKHNLSQAIEDVADFTSRNRPDLILLDLDELPVEELWMVGTLREAMLCHELPIIYLGVSKKAALIRKTTTPHLDKLVNKHETKQLTRLIDDLLSKRSRAAANTAN